MAVGAVFILAGFKDVYLGRASAVYRAQSDNWEIYELNETPAQCSAVFTSIHFAQLKHLLPLQKTMKRL